MVEYETSSPNSSTSIEGFMIFARFPVVGAPFYQLLVNNSDSGDIATLVDQNTVWNSILVSPDASMGPLSMWGSVSTLG